MSQNDRITQLPLRRRETFGADGDVVRTETVHCPARSTSVETDDCLRCGYCTRSPTGSETTLGCTYPGYHKVAPQPPTALRDVMTRQVICVSPELAAESLATLFLERNISAVPVIDADGRPIGVASKTDLVRWYREEASFGEASDAAAALEPGLSTREVRTTTVADLMMPLAFTLAEDAPLAYAAALMTVEGIHHLPIVSRAGAVVGIVSALDLVRWMSRRAGYFFDEPLSIRML